MNITNAKLNEIKSKTSGYWAQRIITQIEYAINLSNVGGSVFNDLIKDTVKGKGDGSF